MKRGPCAQDILERNIKRASDKNQADYQEVMYECYGPGEALPNPMCAWRAQDGRAMPCCSPWGLQALAFAVLPQALWSKAQSGPTSTGVFSVPHQSDTLQNMRA